MRTDPEPGGQRRAGPGRPAVLDRAKIVAAALRLHPDRVTMQAVARDLGVATSALYRWVRDRDELLDLVSVELSRRLLPDTAPTAHDWQEWLVDFAHRVRTELHAVPGLAVRVLTGPHREAGHTAIESRGVQAFVLAGATPERARQYWFAFAAAVVGWVAVEQNHEFTDGTDLDFDVLLRVLLHGVAADT